MREGSDPHAPTRSLSPAATPSLLEKAVELAPGDRVGRYVVRRRLGQGGMGVVFEAEDQSLRRRVALKLLLRTHDPREAARLVREARAAAGLSHPNVVTVHEVGLDDNGPFIAMELVAGQTGRQWLAAEPRGWRAILEVFRQAGLGLAAAHAAGIVHRDVKPDNILVGDDGRVRVVDFGLAHGAGEEPAGSAEQDSPDDDRLTLAGTVVGTPHYMAPEQRRGDTLDARADQYAFCVALRDALPSAPAWVDAAIRRGLAEAPAARWPDMGALVAELGRDPARRRRRILLAIAGVTVAVAAAALAYRAGAPPDPCAGSERDLAGVWDADRRGALGQAFATTGKPRAAAAFERVAARLDAYAVDWSHARERSCRDTRERGAQSEQLFDLRARCLERELGRVDAVVALIIERPADAVDKAIDAVRESTSDLCEDDQALVAAYPPPADPTRRARADAIDREITTLRLMSNLGRMKEAVVGLRDLVPRARELDHPPVLASAVYGLAWTEGALGNLDTAIQLYNEAVRVAGRAHADDIAARSWTELLNLHGNMKEDQATMLAILPAVEAAVARHDTPRMRAHLAGTLGRIYQKQGKLAEARAQYQTALRELERLPLTRDLSAALINMSWIERGAGRYGVAEMYLRRALEITVSLYGEQNLIAGDIWQNLGHIFLDQNRIAEGRAAHEKTLAIYQALLPSDNRRLIIQEENLTVVALQANELDEAERRYLEVAAMAGRALKPDDPIRGPILTIGGAIALSRKQVAASRARCAEATALLSSVGRRDRQVVEARACLGRALLEAGATGEAVTELETAVALGEAIGLPPAILADQRWALARAWWKAGRRADAEELAARAVADTPEAQRADARKMVDDWKRTRGK